MDPGYAATAVLTFGLAMLGSSALAPEPRWNNKPSILLLFVFFGELASAVISTYMAVV